MRRHTAASSDVVVIGCIAAGVTKSNAIGDSVVQVQCVWQGLPQALRQGRRQDPRGSWNGR
jgi:hypothetical protein